MGGEHRPRQHVLVRALRDVAAHHEEQVCIRPIGLAPPIGAACGTREARVDLVRARVRARVRVRVRLGVWVGAGLGLGLGLGLEARADGEGDAADALLDLGDLGGGDARVLSFDAHLG